MFCNFRDIDRRACNQNAFKRLPDFITVIIDEAKRLTGLVNDLLDISKIQAGVTELSTQEFDITESIKAELAKK